MTPSLSSIISFTSINRPPSSPIDTTTTTTTTTSSSSSTPPLSSPPSSPSPDIDPPSSPYPWTWRCPCGRLQPIACKRCLNCSVPFKPNHRTAMNSASHTTKNSIRYDFDGWEDWLNWRHDHVEFATDPERWRLETTRTRDKVDTRFPDRDDLTKEKCVEEWRCIKRRLRRIKRFTRQTHDCFIDCFFPSQCKWAVLKQHSVPSRPSDESSSSSDQENIPPAIPRLTGTTGAATGLRRSARIASSSHHDGTSSTGPRARADTPRPRKRRARRLPHQKWESTKSWLNPDRYPPQSPRSPPPE